MSKGAVLKFQPKALEDLYDIGDYVDARNPGAALRLTRALYAQCERVAEQPLLYRLRPELGEDIRLCAMDSYVIAFALQGDTVTVLRILHGAQQLRDWL